MSEQPQQLGQPDASSPESGPKDAPFCPIDLPMQPTQGKLSSTPTRPDPAQAEGKTPATATGPGSPPKQPLLLPARSSAAQKPHGTMPIRRPARRPAKTGDRSHDLLVRAPRSESTPRLIEETGDRLHAPPPLKRKPRKSKRHLDRARRRQMNYLQIRRQQKRKRLIYNRLRLLLKTGFAAIWLMVIWEIVQAPFWDFNAPHVVLKSAGLIREANLEPLVTPHVGQPVYRVEPRLIADAVKAAYPVVDEVYVRRRLFPTRLELTVVEKQPWAAVYPSEKATAPAAVITTNHQIIPVQPGMRLPDKQAGTENAPPLARILMQPRQSMDAATLERLYVAHHQLSNLPALPLLALDARDPDRILADYAEVDVIVGRLDPEVSERLARLVPLAPRVLELRHEVEKIDLRWSRQVTLHRRKAPLSTGEGDTETPIAASDSTSAVD